MKNRFKMIIGFFLTLLLVSSCAPGLMGRNIQTTTDYDGVWHIKVGVGSNYYKYEISTVDGRFHKKYPNGSVLEGYISADGKFRMYLSFNHGGWNAGSFSFTLYKERSTTSRLVGWWSGLDGAYMKHNGREYGGGPWEVIIGQRHPTKAGRDKSTLSKDLIVTGTWEGVSDDLIGKFKTDSTINRGSLEVRSYDPNMTCSGQWMWAKGEYGSRTAPQGTWSLACINGITAAGTYISRKPGKGKAEGRDNQNRKVILRFNYVEE